MSMIEQTTKPNLGRGKPGYEVTDAIAAESFRRFSAKTNIDRNSNAPLWVQLKNELETAIRGGVLTERSRLPSEQAMCEIFSISRPVVRNALAALVSEGLIVKQPRRGIFVAGAVKEFGFMTTAAGVFDDLSSRGYDVSVITYDFGVYPADEKEKQALKLPEGFDVIRFVRVYSADGSPITHTRISLPAHRLPGMENIDMENRSIFETIRENYGLVPAAADRWINARNADALIAERLNVEEGASLLYIQSIALDHKGLPLEFYRSYYNGEVMPIHISTEALTIG